MEREGRMDGPYRRFGEYPGPSHHIERPVAYELDEIPLTVVLGAAFGGMILFIVVVYCWWRCYLLSWKRKNLSPDSTPPSSPKDAGNEDGVKISLSSPDIPSEFGSQESMAGRDGKRLVRQTTEPVASDRHTSFRRKMVDRHINFTSVDFTIQSVRRKEQPPVGQIRPELYKQPAVENLLKASASEGVQEKPCGKLHFSLLYNHDTDQLVVRLDRAEGLPAKDFSGTSDPYIKLYLLPERKRKFQTKVHRKTLSPIFNETFCFSVPYKDLHARELQFSIYDFDRFSRHDLIGQVTVTDLLEETDLAQETWLWKDVISTAAEKVDLGEIMFSLCYLPTAGRLTLTIIKARNLKAMDITGTSDPFVKVSLMCEGKKLKKRKTSVKKNTLNPVWNEAIVFDVPPENMDQVSLHVSVVDFDRVGHSELIGMCDVGQNCAGPGREHWTEMLANPRKPVAQWHQLADDGSPASGNHVSPSPNNT
ncbi:synaptotagmin-9-like [Branchiostoma floridae x Branchiostoma belcheri]